MHATYGSVRRSVNDLLNEQQQTTLASSDAACLYISRFAAWVSYSVCLPTMALYLRTFTPSLSALAFALAAHALGDLLGQPAFGVMARLSRSWRVATVASLIIGCGASVSYAAASSAWQAVVAQGMMGVWGGCDRGLGLAVTGMCLPEDQERVSKGLSVTVRLCDAQTRAPIFCFSCLRR